VDLHSALFSNTQVLDDVVDPWKKKMMDKAKNDNLFTKWPHLWICVCQNHKTKRKIRLIPLLVERGPHGERGVPRSGLICPGAEGQSQ
jgi:hypothetical protein